MRDGVVLVTGAAGFAGSHLLEHLVGSADLAAWSRSDPPGDLAPLARWWKIDLLDRDQVARAIRELRPESIYHCAGLPHVDESWTDTAAPLAVNALGTHRLIEAAASIGTRCRILITGSAQIYAPSPDPIDEESAIAPCSPYAFSKLAQEQVALRSGPGAVEVIVTRSFNHTGPRQKPSFVAPSVARQIALIERGALEPAIRVGNLDAQRDIIDVRDTVRAYASLMAAGAPGAVYNVASGVGRPVRDLVHALLARARVPISIIQDPSRFRPSDIPVLVGNPRRLREATGWHPAISFDRMLDDLLDFWRTHAAARALS